MLVIGKRIVELSGGRPITIEGGSAAAAVEVMTRFATHPKWLIYLPPTMSPPATTARDGLLEQPDEAFAYYRDDGVGAVVVEEKHMGSRALLVVCRDEAAARDRFGVTTGETGAIYTRTGRLLPGAHNRRGCARTDTRRHDRGRVLGAARHPQLSASSILRR